MLAATRLIALHKNKGMTVAACLKNRTDYIENPDKTEQGQYVSSYACSALTADEEFMLTKRQYDLCERTKAEKRCNRLSDTAVLPSGGNHRRGG